MVFAKGCYGFYFRQTSFTRLVTTPRRGVAVIESRPRPRRITRNRHRHGGPLPCVFLSFCAAFRLGPGVPALSHSHRLEWRGLVLCIVWVLIGGILLDAKNSENYFRTFYIRR